MYTLCNPQASASATALHQSLQQRTQPFLAQHDFINSGTKYCDLIARLCDKRPQIWGSDFSFRYVGHHPNKIRHCGPANLSEPGSPEEILEQHLEQLRAALVQSCIQQHKRGHWITLMWHCPPPHLGDDCRHHELWTMEQRPDQAWWNELCEPNSALHQAWCKQVDRIAQHLKQLQDHNIPVLWRPYHEMNGIWFWWCNKPGTAGYQRLYRMLYQRFTEFHKLNNLIWVWNTNAPRDKVGDEAYPYALFYPGDDVVDVLAADVYHNDYQQSHHDQLLELGHGKLIALGEVGHVPTPALMAQQDQWAWIMPWGNLVRYFNDDQAIKAWAAHCQGI